MMRTTRVLGLSLLVLVATSSQVADLDRSAVDFTIPSDIQVWGLGPATSAPAEKR